MGKWAAASGYVFEDSDLKIFFNQIRPGKERQVHMDKTVLGCGDDSICRVIKLETV